MSVREVCSCGASIDLPIGPSGYSRFPTDKANAADVLDKWRTQHKHDFPPAQPPSLPERDSGVDAMVERSEPVPIGFASQPGPGIGDGDD